MSDPSLKVTPTPVLLRRVRALTSLLICGKARGDDIDRYVAMQLELAGRSDLDMVLDPRD